MNLILDTSVVIKWYIRENLEENAVCLKSRVEDEKIQVAVPRFFFIESANVLWKKYTIRKDIDKMDAKGIFSRILDLPFKIIEDDDVLLKALSIALENSLSIYDALYLASALHFKAKFITADIALVKQLSKSSLQDHIISLSDFA